MKVTESIAFPSLYQAADKASINFQKKHYRSHIWHMIALISASAVSAFVSDTIPGAIAIVAVFLASLGLVLYQKFTRNESLWYNSRAVAESIKTRTWRWMMCAHPYSHGFDESQAIELFIADLKDILQKNMKIASEIQIDRANTVAITDVMKQVRRLPVNDRLTVYRENRVSSQAEWYRTKAKSNKDAAQTWFFITIALHVFALICMLYKISNLSTYIPIGVLTTMASAAMSWTQSKKFNELSAAYSLTSHEIILINGECTSIEQEDSLSDYILSTESAFSREHTQWIARRVN